MSPLQEISARFIRCRLDWKNGEASHHYWIENMRLYSMGLIQPAKLNGHDLHVCLRDVFEAPPNSGAAPYQRASGPGLLGQVA